jgi:signal transduction histidine kinase
VLQSLYAIGLSLETSRRTRAQELVSPSPAEHIIGQLNKLIHEIRRMIRSLNDGTVHSFDLRTEIDELARTYQQVGQLDITVLLQPRALDLLTHEEEQELLNIVREALSNCVRHAHASRATVRLQHRKSRIRLAIADNGIGFSMEGLGAPGYGLANMEARARKLGGMLHIRSRIGRGTTILAEFSLEPILTSV